MMHPEKRKFKIGDLVRFTDVFLEIMAGSRIAIVKKVGMVWAQGLDKDLEWITLHLADGSSTELYAYELEKISK